MPVTPIFEKKNVLVTGGAGFIGSHLCEKLLKDAKVICLDSFINSDERNIDHLLQNPNFEFIRWNVNEPLDLEQFPELEKFKVRFQGIQEIYHLACPTSIKNFDQFRMDTLLTNCVGMRNALDLAVKYKAKFLYASSSVVYGPRRPDGLPFREDDIGAVNHMTPRGCYDEGKRFGETMVQTYAEVYGMDAKIARIFRTYGPRQRLFDGELFSDFIVNAIDGKELTIYGDETFTTSLTYVDDVVDGILKLMKAPATIGPVNLGTDHDVRIVDVAKLILTLTQSGSKVVFEPALMFLTPLGLPDIGKAKERLGWLPLVRLEDGIKKAIDYTQAHRSLISFGT